MKLSKFLLIISVSFSFSLQNSSSKLQNLFLNLHDTRQLTVERHKQPDFNSGAIVFDSSGSLQFIDYNSSPPPGTSLVATAKYQKTMKKIGWSHLNIKTFNKAQADVQSFAAGYLEGLLCAQEIIEFFKNLVGLHENEQAELNSTLKYYARVEQSIRKKTSKEELLTASDDDKKYWLTVAMVQAQTDGMLAGYNAARQNMVLEELDLAKLYFLNGDGEVPELMKAAKRESNSNYRFSENFLKKPELFSKEYLLRNFGSSDPEKVWLNLMKTSHCSAFIRPLINDSGLLTDVLFSHSTWDSYSEMHRIMKSYEFEYTLVSERKNFSVLFSSYPGTITSTDDFYTINRHLVVSETTIEILDESQFKPLDATKHIPNYIRIFTANSLASNGKEWTEVFSRNNSGTYNSQWMVVDYNKISRNLFDVINNIHKQNKGLLHVLEQVPDKIVTKDMTKVLMKQGFWASINRPSFDETKEISGFTKMQERYGNTFSYEFNARATIFQSAAPSVKNVATMQRLMRENRGINNEKGGLSVSPRFDLSKEEKRLSGGTDTKVVDYDMVKKGEILAISGPSTENDAAPFVWQQGDYPRFGLPEKYDFAWYRFNYEGYSAVE